MSAPKSSLKNKDLVLIYQYLHQQIDTRELMTGINRSRTNVYYYIGRAVAFWLKTGVIQFKKISNKKQLGGRDL